MVRSTASTRAMTLEHSLKLQWTIMISTYYYFSYSYLQLCFYVFGVILDVKLLLVEPVADSSGAYRAKTSTEARGWGWWWVEDDFFFLRSKFTRA